jgi:hypothetical protein
VKRRRLLAKSEQSDAHIIAHFLWTLSLNFSHIRNNTVLSALIVIGSGLRATAADNQPFVHPGLLHSREDFDRMRIGVNQGDQPWTAGWQLLLHNSHASLAWKPNPQKIVYRGFDGTHAENYSALFNDVAAAYALALRWKISGDDAYAGKAIAILDAWSSTLTAIQGTSDRYLAAGIYGYELGQRSGDSA